MEPQFKKEPPKDFKYIYTMRSENDLKRSKIAGHGVKKRIRDQEGSKRHLQMEPLIKPEPQKWSFSVILSRIRQ